MRGLPRVKVDVDELASLEAAHDGGIDPLGAEGFQVAPVAAPEHILMPDLRQPMGGKLGRPARHQDDADAARVVVGKVPALVAQHVDFRRADLPAPDAGVRLVDAHGAAGQFLRCSCAEARGVVVVAAPSAAIPMHRDVRDEAPAVGRLAVVAVGVEDPNRPVETEHERPEQEALARAAGAEDRGAECLDVGPTHAPAPPGAAGAGFFFLR